MERELSRQYIYEIVVYEMRTQSHSTDAALNTRFIRFIRLQYSGPLRVDITTCVNFAIVYVHDYPESLFSLLFIA